MMYHGEEGYINSVKKMVGVTRELAEGSVCILLRRGLTRNLGMKKIKGIRLMFDPSVTVLAWTSDDFNVFALSDIMCDVRMCGVRVEPRLTCV